MICDNISVNEKGELLFASYNTVDLAKKYKTPLYLVDENKIRERVRAYKKALSTYFPSGSLPEFASKALSIKQIYRIMKEEKIDIDVVSVGEIYTALKAGFPMENVFFHGNNKTDFDIDFALENGVGYFVCDNDDEIEVLNEKALEKGIKQKVLLRVSPGIDPHTHKKISTGSVESKFGMAIETGQAKESVLKILSLDGLELVGLHCHIGSQIFESEPFITASEIMVKFISELKDSIGFECKMLNLGGGLGVRYTENDPIIDYDEKIREIGKGLSNICKEHNIEMPIIHMEPGRSIVADAGMTLYTVGSVKEIKGYKNYISVDGGMADNPRYILYQSEYTFCVANRASEPKTETVTIAGKCCESGDLLGEGVKLQKAEIGDTLAVLTTGAYNYSMASHYNRIPNPAVVMVKDGMARVIVKRETYEDIIKNDL